VEHARTDADNNGDREIVQPSDIAGYGVIRVGAARRRELNRSPGNPGVARLREMPPASDRTRHQDCGPAGRHRHALVAFWGWSVSERVRSEATSVAVATVRE
jgi:hypothetical protein